MKIIPNWLNENKIEYWVKISLHNIKFFYEYNSRPVISNNVEINEYLKQRKHSSMFFNNNDTVIVFKDELDAIEFKLKFG